MRRKRRGVETTAESTLEAREELVGLMPEVVAHTETSPRLTGGDIDADWQAAYSSGEESVGGSVATPDQDIVDEIGRALGVEQEIDAPVRASDEILRARDRLRWHLERVQSVYDAHRKWAEETLEKRSADLRGQGIKTSWRAMGGVPFEEIANVAREEHAEMIVIGTHGRSGLNRVLLGSVAEHVIRLAPCPVLTVRQPERSR